MRCISNLLVTHTAYSEKTRPRCLSRQYVARAQHLRGLLRLNPDLYTNLETLINETLTAYLGGNVNSNVTNELMQCQAGISSKISQVRFCSINSVLVGHLSGVVRSISYVLFVKIAV